MGYKLNIMKSKIIAAALALTAFTVSATNTKRPNIIFILTDDHRVDALGYAGNPIIKTPTLDKMAREGVYFKNAFVTTPICAASRASILTGLYERTHGYTFQQADPDEMNNLANDPKYKKIIEKLRNVCTTQAEKFNTAKLYSDTDFFPYPPLH